MLNDFLRETLFLSTNDLVYLNQYQTVGPVSYTHLTLPTTVIV